MSETKIIITGITDLDVDKLMNKIIHTDDSMNIIPKFTTNKDDASFYNKYLDVMTANLAFKNNSLIYISTINYISTGITTDDFISNDVCFIDLKNFNNIPDKIFKDFDILVIWLDSKNVSLSNSDKIESKFFQERIMNLKYMYFLDESLHSINEQIFKYLNANEEERKFILEENS